MPVDEFRLVARQHAGLDESYRTMSEADTAALRAVAAGIPAAMRAAEDGAAATMRAVADRTLEGLTVVPVPVTLDSAAVPPLATERAALERRLRRPVPPVATREELLGFALRETRVEDEPLEWAVNDPGDTSLTAALSLIRDNTVATVRGLGVPLGPGWDDKASLFDARLATSVVYVGPGFAAMFGPTGKLMGTPFGTSWRVVSAPNPDGLSLGGIYFSIKVDRGGRGFQEWVLPLHPSGEAFRAIEFGPRLMELTPSMRAGLREWVRGSNSGLITVVSPSYWDRKGITDAVTEAPHRMWLMAERCLAAGYFEDAVRELGGQLADMSLSDLARMVVDILPGALDQAGRLGHAIGMGIWGAQNEDADIDVAARLLAPPAAELLFGVVVAKVVHGVWKAAKGEKVPGGAIDDGRPTEPSRGLAAEPPVKQPLATMLTDAAAALASRGLLVAATDIINAGVRLGRAAVRAFKAWFEGELYRMRDGIYLIADNLKDKAIRIGLELDAWASGRRGLAMFTNPGGILLDLLAAHMYRLAVEALGRDAMTAREAQILSRLDDAAWKRVMDYAAKGETQVHSVKGKLQEELIFHTPEFQQAIEHARSFAELEGFPPGSVRFIREVRGETGMPGTEYEIGEVTDGIIAAVQDLPKGRRIVRIYDVFESKSQANLRDVAVSRGGGTGQLGKDFERFRELPTEIEGQWLQPDQIVISRTATQWWVFEPGEKGLTLLNRRRIVGAFPKFSSIVAPVRSSVLERVAQIVHDLMRSEDAPLVPKKGPGTVQR